MDLLRFVLLIRLLESLREGPRERLRERLRGRFSERLRDRRRRIGVLERYLFLVIILVGNIIVDIAVGSLRSECITRRTYNNQIVVVILPPVLKRNLVGQERI